MPLKAMMAWNTAMRMQQVRRTFLDGSSMSTGSVSSTRYVSATPRTRTTLGMKWKVNAAGVGSGCVAKWWKSAVMLPAPPPCDTHACRRRADVSRRRGVAAQSSDQSRALID